MATRAFCRAWLVHKAYVVHDMRFTPVGNLTAGLDQK